MADVMPQIHDGVEAEYSLATLQRSINDLAAELHEMFTLIKEVRSEFLGTRDQQAESEWTRKNRSHATKELKQWEQLSGTRFSDSMLLAAEASKEDQSSLDPTWPGSLHLRPAIQALELHHIAPFAARSRTFSFEEESASRQRDMSTDEGTKRGIILPASRLRITLDFVGLCLLTWDLIVTPVQLAWSLNIEGWLYVFAVLVSSFWTLDMLTFFRTAFFTKEGELETRSLKLAMHYLRHTFAIDFLIVICDWVNLITIGLFPSGLNLLRAMKLTRLLRIRRLIAVTQFETVADLFNILGIGPAMFESIKIFAFTMWLTHIISCMWFAIGNMNATDTGSHWLDLARAENSPSFAESKFSYQYTSALQWTMTTMLSGSSSILPLNSAEQVVSCSCILVGLMVQAFVVSVLSSSAVEEKAYQRNQTVAVSEMNRFCSNHRVRADLALMARSQIKASFILKNRAALEINQNEGLQKISPKLRTRILCEVFEPQLSRHALFLLWSQADRRSFSRLTSDLMAIMYAQRGHDVFLAGDTALGTYLLSKGEAKYSQSPESSKVTDDIIEAVVSNTWVCEPALWIEWSHVGTMEAITDDCEVHMLHMKGFLELVASTRNAFKQILRSYAILYHERTTQSVPPAIPWPSDMHTHGTNFVQILTSMHESVRSTASVFALDYGEAAGIIDKAQSEILMNEIKEGKINLTIARTNLCLSVQRVLSVARVVVYRSDNRFFAEIGKWLDNQFIINVQLPGAKQLGSENIFTTVKRVADRLTPVTGRIAVNSTSDYEEVLVSKRVNLKTHYYFFDACFSSSDRTSVDTLVHISESARASAQAQHKRRLAISLLSLRSSRTSRNPIAEDLERRMFDENELFLISKSAETNSERLCMWLTEQELSFLKSADGCTLVQAIVENGGLTTAAAIRTAPNCGLPDDHDDTRQSCQSCQSQSSGQNSCPPDDKESISESRRHLVLRKASETSL